MTDKDNKYFNSLLAKAKTIFGSDAQIVFIGGNEPWSVSVTCIGGRKLLGKGEWPDDAIRKSCSCFTNTEKHLENCNIVVEMKKNFSW